jgi:CRISPR-associated exonuclease Cas4
MVDILLSEADNLVPLSALQHLLFCERQAALIHIERVWKEDTATAEGRVLHERADLPGRENRRGVRVERSLMLRSKRLMLYGVADAVEFPARGSNGPPFPVEYKRGRIKDRLADQVQLCAQALCLEEMLGVAVPCGAIFYGESHRRLDVPFDETLRKTTEDTALRMHALIRAGVLPKPVDGPKCRRCSLESLCLPKNGGCQENPPVFGPLERRRRMKACQE